MIVWYVGDQLFRLGCNYTVLQSETQLINHCSRHITHFGELDIFFVLLKIYSKFISHLECYLLPHKRLIKISK
jgi:hypothetical protein